MLGGRYLNSEELRTMGFKNVGKDVKIHSRASIYGIENLSLENNIRIDDFVVIVASGPLTIGNHVNICNFCFLGTRLGVSIGNHVTMAPGVKVFTVSDDYNGIGLTGATVPEELTNCDKGFVKINDFVIIGANSTVLPGITIGAGASVGAHSLIKNDLGSWSIYAGTPAKFIKRRNKAIIEKEKALYQKTRLE